MASNLTKEERLAVHQNDLSVRAGSTLADHTALANPPAGGRFAPHSPEANHRQGSARLPEATSAFPLVE